MIPHTVSDNIFSELGDAFANKYRWDSGSRMGRAQKVWSNAKGIIYQLFGNQLIVSSRVESLPIDGARLRTMFYNEVCKNNARYHLVRMASESLSPKEIAGNKLARAFNAFGKTFPKNMKVSKMFQELVLEEDREQFNLAYSLFLQKAKNKGTINLSIDPRDFITMSTNNAGWSTCQHIFADKGAATLSLMQDVTTVVAYASQGDAHAPLKDLPGLVWNSKTWRQLIHICTRTKRVFFNEQYPFYAEQYTTIIIKMLEDCFNKFYSSNDTMEIYLDSQYGAADVLAFNESFVYNDPEHKGNGKLYYMANQLTDVTKLWSLYDVISIGTNHIFCVCCEEMMDHYDSSEHSPLVCDGCHGCEDL